MGRAASGGGGGGGGGVLFSFPLTAAAFLVGERGALMDSLFKEGGRSGVLLTAAFCTRPKTSLQWGKEEGRKREGTKGLALVHRVGGNSNYFIEWEQ